MYGPVVPSSIRNCIRPSSVPGHGGVSAMHEVATAANTAASVARVVCDEKRISVQG